MKTKLETAYSVKLLYITKSGSQLYGTNDESSDTDYKCIFVPDKSTLLLGEANFHYKAGSNPSNEKNTSVDIDCDLDSVQKWLKSVRDGETGALDILFSVFDKTSTVYIDPTFEEFVKTNYLKLLSKRPSAFVGYCNGQAKKYSIKGERYNELKSFIALYKDFSYNGEASLSSRFITLKTLTQKVGFKYVSFVMAPGPRKTTEIEYLEVLGRKFAPSVSQEFLLDKLETLLAEYGERAKDCHTNVEWKSLSHAVRVVDEVVELLSTNFITFPLPNAAFIYKVKRGTVELQEVLDYISLQMSNADKLMITSKLPEKANKQIMDDYILSLY